MHTTKRWSSRGPSALNLCDPGGAGWATTHFIGACPAPCRRLLHLAATGLLLVAVGACGSTPPATGEAGATASSGDGRARQHADQPPGTEPDAVAPYLRELLLDYDRLVHEFTLDPTIAQDDDHPVVVELAELFDADSELPHLVLESWANDYGRPPEGDDRAALISTVDTVETVSEDEVELSVCTRQRIYAYDEDARRVRGIGYEDGSAHGSAVRVDGAWLLHDLRVAEGENCNEEETP